MGWFWVGQAGANEAYKIWDPKLIAFPEEGYVAQRSL
jgi:hypothetical protein